MPDLGGLAALDVAIGLVALFFLLSTAISAINEGIANLLGWRAKTLEDAIRNMVGDPQLKQNWKQLLTGRIDRREPAPRGGPDQDTTLKLFNHWRVRSLVRDPDSRSRRRARPSYMSPRAFSLALAEVLAEGPPETGDKTKKSPWELADKEIFERVKHAVDGLPEGQLRSLVQKAANNAHESLDGFRTQLEHAFDDSMERASGWYKRKVQAVLLVLAALIVIGLNVNTVHVATVLWNDDALRSAVATRAAAQGTPEDAAQAVDDISELELPVGWGPNATEGLLPSIPGWLITIAALNLGAPFWFDLLSRLARLRGSGVPERPRSLSDTAGTVESERAARSERAAARLGSSGDGAQRRRRDDGRGESRRAGEPA
jgi:hypothetical protein